MGKALRHRGIPIPPNGVPPDENGSFLSIKYKEPAGYGEVLRIAVPLILSTASLTLMLFVDRMFLSWHGQNSVAASTPGGITYFTICCLFMGTAQYVNTIVAQHHGAGDKPACARAVWQGLRFSVLSIPLILALIPVGFLVLEWADHGPELLALEKEYFFILMFGGLSLPFGAALSSFFSGRGKTRVVMWGNVLCNAANIVLDYILIFGKLGFPEMGIVGAGIASAVTCYVPVVYWGVLFLAKKYQPVFRTRKEHRWDRNLFMMIIRYGIPSGVQFFLDVAAFTLFVLLVGRLGALDLAVTNIVLSIEMLAFLPMVGMSIATSTLVGEYIGRKNLALAEKCVYSALKLAMAYSIFFAVIYLALPEAFLSLFSSGKADVSEAGMIAKGVILLRLVAIYTLFDNMFIVFSGALKGAGDTRFAMWTQIGLSWFLFVPAVYVAIEYMNLGIMTAWICLLVYVVLLGMAFYLRFRAGAWKKIEMLGERDAAA
jgi:MATE family, multidrug efflux pump